MQIPKLPKFLLMPDGEKKELYIMHNENPKCIIWLYQKTPPILFIIDSFGKDDNISEQEYEKLFTPVLYAAKDFYYNEINKGFEAN